MSVASSPVRPAEGERVMREDTVSVANVARVCAMLDLDPVAFGAGSALPQGWQFILMAADTPRANLRADGFPGLGVPMPDLGLPRLVLGGREVTFHAEIPVGSGVSRESGIASIQQKQGANGPMAIVAIHHALRVEGRDAIALEEQQTYVMLSAGKPQTSAPAPARAPASLNALKRVVPDDTLLFQYSALGFNSHKIHLDRDYAKNVEGYPDLVVNGGLINLIMSEFLRVDLGIKARRTKTRHLSPAYANQPIFVEAEAVEGKQLIRALNEMGVELAQMEVFAP